MINQTKTITLINAAWEKRTNLNPELVAELSPVIKATLAALDAGQLRVAEKIDGIWQVQQWLKQAILLSFRLNDSRLMTGGAEGSHWWDKVASKFSGWEAADFQQTGFRAVPNCVVRHGSYVAPNVVLMPCFVNIGAHIGAGTMIDTWSTVGSCAQVGKNCHISGGVGLGGVLEPLQANPVIIEDDCFIGARSEIAEGVIVEQGAVLSMGVFIGASTKIIDRQTGEIFQGRVPAYSVVVPGTLPAKPLANGETGPALACAVIVKRVDAQTRAKTSVNDLLRY